MAHTHEQEPKEVTPIPTPKTALHSLGIRKPFKPEGRSVVPQDCVTYDDCFYSEESVSLTSDQRLWTVFLIRKLFERGESAASAYTDYCNAATENNPLVAEKANTVFKEITGFGLEKVVEFENKVRAIHGVNLLPQI